MQAGFDQDDSDANPNEDSGGGGGGGGGGGFDLASAAAGFILVIGLCILTGLPFGLNPFAVPSNDLGGIAKECALDAGVRIVANVITQSLLSSYLNWTSDKKFFLDDPVGFWQDEADAVLGKFLENTGLGYFCNNEAHLRYNFTALLKAELDIGVINESTCKLSDIHENITNSSVGANLDVDADLTVLGYSESLGRDLFIRPLSFNESYGVKYVKAFYTAKSVRDKITGDVLSKREQVSSPTGALVSSYDRRGSPGEGCTVDENSGIAGFVDCLTKSPTVYADYTLISENFSFSTQLPIKQVSEADEVTEFSTILSRVVNLTISNVFQAVLEGGIEEVNKNRTQLSRSVHALGTTKDGVLAAFLNYGGYIEAEEYAKAADDAEYLLTKVIGDGLHYRLTKPYPGVSIAAYVTYTGPVLNQLNGRRAGTGLLSKLRTPQSIIPNPKFEARKHLEHTLLEANDGGDRVVKIPRYSPRAALFSSSPATTYTYPKGKIFYYGDIDALIGVSTIRDAVFLQKGKLDVEEIIDDYKSTLGVYLHARGGADAWADGVYKNESPSEAMIRSELLGNAKATPDNVERSIITKIRNKSLAIYTKKNCTTPTIIIGGQSLCKSGTTLGGLQKKLRETRTKDAAQSLAGIIYSLYENNIIDIPRRAGSDVRFEGVVELPYGQGYDREKTTSFGEIFSEDESSAFSFIATNYTNRTIITRYNRALRGRVERAIQVNISDFLKSIPGANNSVLQGGGIARKDDTLRMFDQIPRFSIPNINTLNGIRFALQR